MTRWHSGFSTGSQRPEVGDVDGDGKADIITFDPSTARVFVAISNGTQFGARSTWQSSFSPSGETPRVGDVNGDGRADAVSFVQTSAGTVGVALSCGTDVNRLPPGCSSVNTFGARIAWASSFSLSGEVPRVADVNNDGLADLITFRADGNTQVALTRRHACTTAGDCTSGLCFTQLGICPESLGEGPAAKAAWGSGLAAANGATLMMADMNGDGYADAVDFQTVNGATNGNFDVALSNGSAFATFTVWGATVCRRGDVCAVGDANRDGKADAFDFIAGGRDAYFLSNP
jgi:hypothetical protein